jgi:DNA-binding GntR family transcriptional regulator
VSQSQPKDWLYNAIVRKVFSGSVNAGQRLVERELASEFGVSRIPVREILARLVTQGILVGGEKGQGVFVRRYSGEDIRQLYEFREIQEAGAGAAAARHANESDLLRMAMICDEMEAAIDDFESPRWRDLDHKFHLALAEASHNPRIVSVMKGLLVECFFMFYAPSDERVDTSDARHAIAVRVVEEHRTLIETIRQRDDERAAQMAQGHINWVGDIARRLYIAEELKA